MAVTVAAVSCGDHPELMGRAPWAQQDVAAAAELAVDLLAGHLASGWELGGRRPCPERQRGGSEWCSHVSGSPLLSL